MTHAIHESLAALAHPIDGLNLDPKNARAHDEASVQVIRDSLRRFGQRKPIVVQRGGMLVRAGNGLVMAARAEGWTHVAAVVVDESDVEATAFALVDNRSAELSEWDDAILAETLAAFSNEELPALGFDMDEVAAIRARLVGQGELDSAPAPLPPDEPVTQPGDLWVLGEHRLLCGDSSKPEDVDRLLDGAPIHLANTDPPYNVKVEPRSNNAIAAGERGKKDRARLHHQALDLARHPGKSKGTTRKMRAKDRPLQNDFMPDEEFGRLLLAWFGNISRVLLPGRAFYIWGGYANVGNYPPVLKACELYFSQAVIWVKEHPSLTRKDFMGNHECCFYGWKEGAAHRFFGPPNVPDTWSIKKVNPQSMVHLTEKPVELARRAIEFSSRPGENVLDLFAGSGSTLIAAEATGRRCFTMEIDPAYSDVVVRRWEAVSGKTAALEGHGGTFAAVAAERGVAIEPTVVRPNDGQARERDDADAEALHAG